MRRPFTIALAVLSLIIPHATAAAPGSDDRRGGSDDRRGPGPVLRESEREDRRAVRDDARDARTDARRDAPEIRGELRADVRAEQHPPTIVSPRAAEQFRAKQLEAVTRTRDENAQFVQRLDEQRDGAREQRTRQRATRQDRLRQIADPQQRTRVERVDRLLQDTNERMAKRYVGILDRLSQILARIEQRSNKAAANGVAVSSVRSSVATAAETIAAARNSLLVQAGRTYEVAVTSATALRSAAERGRQSLQQDLGAVERLVRTAAVAVERAASELAKIPKIDEYEVPAVAR